MNEHRLGSKARFFFGYQVSFSPVLSHFPFRKDIIKSDGYKYEDGDRNSPPALFYFFPLILHFCYLSPQNFGIILVPSHFRSLSSLLHPPPHPTHPNTQTTC